MRTALLALLTLAAGCSGRVDADDVTQACCTIEASTSCSGPTVTVQWDDRYWTSAPWEDDAGPCMTGAICSAFTIVEAGVLEPLGNGTCE